MVTIDSILQILLVLMVVQVVGFFVLLIEIFKLSRLIRQEKYDISRFEKDLGSLEARGEHKAEEPSDQLKEYVDRARAKGIPDTEIRQKLEERGWKTEQVDKVLGTASSAPTKP
ncbi:MAG: hypothetical protein HC945_04375 [Nitrosarchaeum sp.]|nr:hypothetical protein [Nitrosarchaeum sp.]